MEMNKECKYAKGYIGRKGKFTSEIFIFSKEDEPLTTRSRVFYVMNLPGGWLVSQGNSAISEAQSWSPLVTDGHSLEADQFWWRKVHFVECMHVLHPFCYGYFIHGLDTMRSCTCCSRKIAYAFHLYSGMLSYVASPSGHISSLVTHNQAWNLHKHTNKPENAVGMENGCQ